MELTAGRGADVVFDPVGGEATAAAVSALAEGARLLCAGFAAGRPTALQAQTFFARDAALLSANVPLMLARDPQAARAAFCEVVAWTVDGTLHPRVAAQFPFDAAPHAFDYLTARRDAGAVVVIRAG